MRSKMKILIEYIFFGFLFSVNLFNNFSNDSIFAETFAECAFVEIYINLFTCRFFNKAGLL